MKSFDIFKPSQPKTLDTPATIVQPSNPTPNTSVETPAAPVYPIPNPSTNNIKTSSSPEPDWKKHSHREGLRSIVTTLILLAAAPLVALLLTGFVFQSYQVEGPSMLSTLHNGDRLIVLKLSRTWSRITKKPFIPGRGEIIVFTRSGLHETNGKAKQLIKRVIALPGERVVVKDGVVSVFNEEHPDGYNPDLTGEWASVIKSTEGNVDIVVPANEVFVCGDNRSNSLDSRSFGTVPVHTIVGDAKLRILPINSVQSL